VPTGRLEYFRLFGFRFRVWSFGRIILRFPVLLFPGFLCCFAFLFGELSIAVTVEFLKDLLSLLLNVLPLLYRRLTVLLCLTPLNLRFATLSLR
jgi:hypothetical protein